jgi:hypothetical protein
MGSGPGVARYLSQSAAHVEGWSPGGVR